MHLKRGTNLSDVTLQQFNVRLRLLIDLLGGARLQLDGVDAELRVERANRLHVVHRQLRVAVRRAGVVGLQLRRRLRE